METDILLEKNNYSSVKKKLLPTVIFDIDGTLANIEHRRHFVSEGKKDWKSFSSEMVNDTPHEDIIDLYRMFEYLKFIILIVSGRSEDDRRPTEEWLRKNNINYSRLYMRPSKDYRMDAIIKSEILDQILKEGYNPNYIFDDRNQCVEMWRKRGFRCLQVADGAF